MATRHASFDERALALFGVVAQPMLLWLLLGTGMTSSFSLQGVEVDYLTYFFPECVQWSFYSRPSLQPGCHRGP